MRVNEGGTRATGTGEAGGSGQNSAAAEAERAAREAQRAAEEAARAAAEAARAQAAQAAQAQARAEAAAKRAQDAMKQAQAALAQAQKQGAPKGELTRAQQAVTRATTSAQQAATSARNAGNRATHASSFVPASATPAQPARPAVPAGPPGVTPGYTKEQAAKDATELYRATKGGVTGWGTDEDAVFKALDKKSPGDIALIRQSFKEHYNLDLDKTLREELSGDDLKRANSILAGNKGNAGAAAIQQQTGWFGDKDAIIKTLQQASPSERQSIARSFQQMYGKDHRDIKASSPEEFMQKALAPSLDDAQKTQLRSLLATTQATAPAQVNQLEATAARTKVHDALQGFFGADSQKVFDTVKDLPAEQKKLLLADTALQAEMKKELSKEDYARARGLLEDNPAAASAAQINSATQGWFGADKGAILDVLKNTKPEEMPALKAAFQSQTGRSLESEVRGWGGNDAAVGLRYLNPPAANDTLGQARADAERLHRAMDGMGTDEAALREVLGNKSKTQINDITAAYRDLYKKDLRSALTSELSGRDKFEIVDQMYDLGAVDMKAPDAAQQQVERLRAQQKFEQSGGLGILDAVQTVTKGESDSARLERNLDAAETAIATGNTDAANTRVSYSTDDVKDVQESKDSAADMVSTAAVVVVTTAAVVATGGAATPLAVAGYAALGAGTRMATQSYFKGDSLGTDGLVQQGALGALEGATAVIPVPKGLGGGSVAAVEGAEQVVKQTVSQRLRSTVIQGAWEGGVGSAASGAADQALQSETWQNGLMPGLAQVGNRALRDGTIGTVFGAGTSAGMDGVMQGASRLTRPKDVPVVPNAALTGDTVRVRYGDGRVQVEAGPLATQAQIQAHMETARALQKYEGPMGQLRQLKDRAREALTGTPGYGTQGFESQLEVKKLKTLIGELEGLQQQLDTKLQKLGNGAEVPSAAQRESIEREVAGLRSQLEVHERLVNSLEPGRGYVAAQQVSKGAAEAKRLGYPDAPADHFWRQREDGALELMNRGDGPRQMYKPSGQEPQVKGEFVDAPTTRVEPKFEGNPTPAEAFELLGGTDPKSSFGSWVKMLKDEGLIKSDQDLISKMHQTPDGLTFRTVRHELKKQYTDQVMDRVTNPALLQKTDAYQQVLKATNSPQQALQAASHSEMLRLTNGLSSADKGAIAERWYLETFGKTRGAQTQVSVSRAEASQQGVILNEDRRIDVMEGGTLRELKNVSTAFGPREHGQVEDLLKLVGNNVNVNGTAQKVDTVVETFLDPRGVQANANWMHEILDPKAKNPIKFEVFKKDGTSVMLDSRNRDILSDPKKLAQFLGMEK